MQVPAPASNRLHVPLAHCVPTLQAPPVASRQSASPVPVPSQALAPEQAVVVEPCAIGVQAVPPAQVPQAPQETAQHTPSLEQALFAHWLAAVHALPSASAVQPLVVHIAVVPLQVWLVPAVQPVAALQVCAGVNVLPLHEAAAQVCAVAATQPVAVLQEAAGV